MSEAQHDREGQARAGARGRRAERPREIPKRGWLDIAKRVKTSISEDNVPLISGGVALFALLAAVPMLTALVLIYGLAASPENITRHVDMLTRVVPADAAGLIRTQLEDLANQERQTLGIGLALTLLLALWSSKLGMSGLMAATNIAYGEREERSFIQRLLVSLALTLAFVLGLLGVLALAVFVPIAVRIAPLGPVADVALLALRWVLLVGFALLGLAVIYRYAPSRREARWRWVSPGATFATVTWLIASLLFGFYVRNFGNYNETYGALGGVIILILWFFITAFAVVLGAEINAETEHQTARDTTAGGRQPMGRRGARAADELGPVPE